MLTQTVSGRIYDFSHAVGRGAIAGEGFSQPVALAMGAGDVVYVLNRGVEGYAGGRPSSRTVGEPGWASSPSDPCPATKSS